jgi:hypothetical protein
MGSSTSSAFDLWRSVHITALLGANYGPVILFLLEITVADPIKFVLSEYFFILLFPLENFVYHCSF